MLRGNETMQHFFETVPNIRKTYKENTVAICSHTFPQASVYEIINPVSKHMDRPGCLRIKKNLTAVRRCIPSLWDARQHRAPGDLLPALALKPQAAATSPCRKPRWGDRATHSSRSKCLHVWLHPIHRISCLFIAVQYAPI